MKSIQKNQLAKGITEIIEDGKKSYKVTICKRTRIDSQLIKIQRKQTCKTKIEAQRVYDKLMESIIREIAKKEGSGKEWLILINEWKADQKRTDYKTISESTVIDYSSLLRNWTHDWMKIPAKEISKQMVQTAIEKIKKERSIKHTAKLKDAIKCVFQWAINNEVVKGLTDSPTYGVSVSRKTNRKTEVLTEEITKKLLQTSRNLGHEWYPVWALAIYTGMRSGELFALKWENINFDKEVIKISEAYKLKTKKFGTTKTGVERVVPINAELMKVLIDLKPKTIESTFVLPRLKDWQNGKQALVLKTFCESIGIKPVCFHTLRATFTTLLLSNGVGLNVVQMLGGWSDITTMNHYNRMTGLIVKDATESLRLIG
jgi:integrase